MGRSILKAWLCNGGILAVVSVTQVEAFLKCAVLLATLLYTLMRCANEARGIKKEKE